MMHRHRSLAGTFRAFHPFRSARFVAAHCHAAAVRLGFGLVALAVTVAMAAVPRAAVAMQWPDKPVRIVVPFSAGGATDLLGRALGVELGKIWGQSVVVDNRPGAGGGVGAEHVATSASDGYTLLMPSASMFTVNPFVYSKLPYSVDSFEMITVVAQGPMVVTVNSAVPAATLQELIAHGKANPGKLHFGSAGNGSQVHMAAEAFADASGLSMVHVPYKGDGPAMADLMAGTIQLVVGNMNTVSPLLKGDRLRALAVTSAERSAMLPDVPTAAEAGVPGFEFVGWFGLAAPAGTPRALVEKIDADVRKAAAQECMKRYLRDQGMTIAIAGPDGMKSRIGSESERWKKLVTARNIRAN